MAGTGVLLNVKYSPGREVHYSHAALFESAVIYQDAGALFQHHLQDPGRLPAALEGRALRTGDPCFHTHDGRIPDVELEAWGPERSFVLHLLRLLALPWHEIIFRYAPDPIIGTERRQLAKDCQAAVQAIFTPVK